MKKITNILNGILGAGANRRSTGLNLRVAPAPVWEVRQKFDTQRKMPAVKAPKGGSFR